MQRNWAIIIGVFIFACGLLALVVWVWWTLLAPAAAPPTPAAVVATPLLPPTEGVPATDTDNVSPTLPAPIVTDTVTPPATPVPTSTPSATSIPSSTPVPATPTPHFTSTPATPHTVMNSPHGFVNVRSGPGIEYAPALGTYQNGVTADVLGKQIARDGQLWWLISFPPGPLGKGWVYASYTDAKSVDTVPWVIAPPTATPVYVTPSPPPRPHAVINSPDGFLNVRSGPGWVYQPPLGRLSSGTTVDIVGKQLAIDGALWWLIPFAGGVNGRGWIYADYTIAKNTANVPWISPPPTPTIIPTRTGTPTPTPTATSSAGLVVDWAITGRVLNATTAQPVASASVQARLGNDGTILSTLTDSNGNFSIVGRARDEGNLVLTVNMFGYEEHTQIAGAVKPRVYNFSNISLVPRQAPVTTWLVTGRVVEIGTGQPLANAQVGALLGDDSVQIAASSAADGRFSLQGQARDSGTLSLTITADNYQPFSAWYPSNDTRVYNLGDLTLVPLADSCAYESVINLAESTALARLQSLKFTSVSTTSIVMDDASSLIGWVITQNPNPPPEGQSVRVNCRIPVTLGIGSRASSP